ncbi:1,4-alpha-glucan branching protein domain-containing protein [Alicyclobacillus sp.]|uniref:1,4-alpha-glucan branching protein domain-containing protein n=1 Tax=Alicyclobacillus sp. TaxID=61169 RepID=UPI0025BE0414|nr:1,4-alpha-glucan branching protein domain-containing protein [Alicyclobacillus sp.]MCL6515562.1 DUF1957 domain-containing protein [Alicyclobacillus sp.]
MTPRRTDPSQLGQGAMAAGHLCVVLHAHLPFVRHPRQASALEERWLFEALLESYLPLTDRMLGWTRDGLPWHLTLSVSPALAAMLADPLLQSRFRAHLDRLIRLAADERSRLMGDPNFGHLPGYYLQQFLHWREAYDTWGWRLLDVWRALADQGHLELIPTAATHAFLPLLCTETSVRAQVVTATEHHTRVFGRPPEGFWLPECGFRPGLDEVLRGAGIRYTFVETHGLTTARPLPVHGPYAPVRTPAGLAVFARDPECGRQVWSATEGYPGDPVYREFYRDIGYERPWEMVAPALPEGVRVDTGLKYWRVTGPGPDKAPYHPERARSRAAEHARHFLDARVEHARRLWDLGHPSPVFTAVYDAELFGHWWYEGPAFLDALIRLASGGLKGLNLTTPGRLLADARGLEVCTLEATSWGRGGYADVWLNPSNDWMYPHLHRMERAMERLAQRHSDDAPPLIRRAVRQAARELMLAQGSDWAFILDHGTATDYALRRVRQHIDRFWCLARMVEEDRPDPRELERVEVEDNLFQDLRPAVYRPAVAPRPPVSSRETHGSQGTVSGGRAVLMLAWEYPPLVVGGLARHVAHLAEALVETGWRVHVVVRGEGDGQTHERVRGVSVHRVHVRPQPETGFLDWVAQLNVALFDLAREVLAAEPSVALVHAHDWLVHPAAAALSDAFALPLVCTVHATEHGRNGGIHTRIQARIHEEERRLVRRASHVIVCSRAMREEVARLFDRSRDEITVIPNGVLRPADRSWAPPAPAGPPTVVFVGRLVYEKGVHVLLDAMVRVLEACPAARLVVIGRGPLEDTLQDHARGLGLADAVRFLGFIPDARRDAWLRRASVCVVPSLYEPFGIAALEAMAQGTPVVVSNAGGLREVVDDGVDGLVAPVGDADALAQRILRVLEDPVRARSLAERARRRVQREFSWGVIAERTAKVYEHVLDPTVQTHPEEAWTE